MSGSPLQRWLNLVEADSSCGADLHEEPAVADLRRRYADCCENDPSAEAARAWQELARDLAGLLDRSRDLRLACRLALAWMGAQGLQGLCDGLRLNLALLRRFGPRLHPLSGAARIEALEQLACDAARALTASPQPGGSDPRSAMQVGYALALLEQLWLQVADRAESSILHTLQRVLQTSCGVDAAAGGAVPALGATVELKSSSPIGPQQAPHGSSLRTDRELLAQVLEQTIPPGGAVKIAAAERQALLDVARAHPGEPLTLDPVATEMVLAVLVDQRQAGEASAVWKRLAARVAKTLFDDPTTQQRLRGLWDRLNATV